MGDIVAPKTRMLKRTSNACMRTQIVRYGKLQNLPVAVENVPIGQELQVDESTAPAHPMI